MKKKKLSDKFYPNIYIDDTPVGRKTKKDIENIYVQKNERIKNSQIYIFYKSESIATISAQTLKLHLNDQEVIDRAYTIGREKNHLARIHQQLLTTLNLKNYRLSTDVVYDSSKIKEYVKNFEEDYNKPAKNALFSFENGKVTSFSPDEKGLKINSEKLHADFRQIIQDLKNKVENKTVVLTDTVVDPEITLAKANNFGIEELIGEGKSNYAHSIPERIHNVALAASKFHGVLIPKDKEFSFNEIIGDISSNTGYKPAYVIKNGRTVLGDGGGVCQVSTTVFRAALNSGLPITERNAHAYRVSYYENDSKPGFDATIFTPSVDLRFKNDTTSSILVQVENDPENTLLTFRFYGKKDDRKVQLSEAMLWDVTAPPPPIYQDDPTLKRGITRQVDFPAWGGKASFTYKVTKSGKTEEQKFLSVYRPWQAVFLVGTAD